MSDNQALTVPSLGHQFELESLHDARIGIFPAGLNLWKLTNVQDYQTIDHTSSINYKFSSTEDELRTNVGLSLEDSVKLDLKLLAIGDKAKFLESEDCSKIVARVDVTCLKTNRSRTIPMETLQKTSYSKSSIEKPFITHFVASVSEGATLNIRFEKKCETAEEAQTVTGHLLSILKESLEKKIPGDFGDESLLKKEDIEVKVSGSTNYPVQSFDEALEAIQKMPELTTENENTLSVTLLPISVLSSSEKRIVRELDGDLLSRIQTCLRNAENVSDELSSFSKIDQLKFMNALTRQYDHFSGLFKGKIESFRKNVRNIFPQFHDPSNVIPSVSEKIIRCITLLENQTLIALNFAEEKRGETMYLLNILNEMENIKLLNFASETDHGTVVFINLSCKQLLLEKHVLSEKLANLESCDDESLHEKSSDDSENDDDFWFEDKRIADAFKRSFVELKQLKIQNQTNENVKYGFGVVPKAYQASSKGKKKTQTQFGDIILGRIDDCYIINGCLPKPPCNLQATVLKQNLSLNWENFQNDVIQIHRYIIQWRPTANLEEDSFDNAYSDNEIWDSMSVESGNYSFDIISYLTGPLKANVSYQIRVAADTEAGMSVFSEVVSVRTERLPTAAKTILEFYLGHNSNKLNKSANWEKVGGEKPPAIEGKTFFLGFRTMKTQNVTTKDYKDEIGVIIVDVIPEIQPELQYAEIKDEKARAIMFVGETGAGKTTEINAMVSYLLEADLSDQCRIMLVDDRSANQAESVTRYITVYRLRPHSYAFEGCTFYIIDTPGYGDTESLKTGRNRDQFITASMQEMFTMIPEINTIVLCSKASLTRATVGITAAVTNIFQLFAQNVQSCLKSVITFSDVSKPPVLDVLKELEWPIEKKRLVEVNNSAFRVNTVEDADDPKIRSWWMLCMRGQRELVKMLSSMEPVPTAQSAQVTCTRLSLQATCEIVEYQVYQAANDTATLLARLNSIASAIGASPGDKIETKRVEVEKRDVAEGKHTTLCIVCNHTCHDVCIHGDDKDKYYCYAMKEGYCYVCPKKCIWSAHKNARFTLVAVEKSEWIVPDELIKTWNENNNTLEGAVLGAMDKFVELQEKLQGHINTLVDLSGKLKKISLRHNPHALKNYLMTLLDTAKAQGASPSQIQSLQAAARAMMVQENVARDSQSPYNESQVLIKVLTQVRMELLRRTKLPHRERVKEEEKPSSLYNKLYDQVPLEIQCKSPKKLSEAFNIGVTVKKGALFPENLKAIVKMITVILKSGSVHSIASGGLN